MSLTVCVADEPIPRPTGAVPGLVVTYALVKGIRSNNHGYLQPVECFLFPGSGQTIVTAGSVRLNGAYWTQKEVHDHCIVIKC
jgi:hypothetical protein